MSVARSLLLAIAALAAAPAAWAHSEPEPVSAETKLEVVVPHPRVRAATIALLDANGHLAKVAAGDRGRKLAELVEVAKQRRADMAALLDSDPAEFLRVALPADKRARLPVEASPFVEDDADETGDLEVLHVDHATPGNDFYLHVLSTPKGKFSLHFAGKAPNLKTGDRVRVRGKKLDQAIVLAAGGASPAPVEVVAASALPRTVGAQSTLVILVNFSNAPTQPFTVAAAQSLVFGTTSDFDYETSYQQTTLTGTVAGWFTIAETNASCNYNTIGSQARTAAAAAGYPVSSYARFVYVFPANTCGWWGLGTVGGAPSHAWINTRYGFSIRVVAHEMGHNLGLYHSHSLDCGAVAVASSGCQSSDYGDVFDVMGSSPSGNAPHFNAFQKERLGWLNAGVSPPLTTVPAVPGTSNYTIAPIEDARNGISRALKIPRSTACGSSNEWLYVESRQPRGFDAYLAGTPNIPTGVVIHKVTEGNADSSFLLDMTPSTAAWADAALVAGQTFTDPLTGVVIAPVSVGSSSSTIGVTFPPAACTRVPPTVALTPSGTVYASAGSSTSYSVSVRNNDSCGCGSSSFDLSASVPAGWSASTARTASASPAGVVSGNLTVVAATSADAAFYPITVTAANTSASAIRGSAAGTIAIADSPPPPPPAAFTATTVSERASYPLPKHGSLNVPITTTVLDGGAAVSAAAVTIRVTDPAGAVTTLTKNTDGSGKAKVNYSQKAALVRKGSYAVTSTATKASSSVTSTTSFVVQ